MVPAEPQTFSFSIKEEAHFHQGHLIVARLVQILQKDRPLFTCIMFGSLRPKTKKQATVSMRHCKTISSTVSTYHHWLSHLSGGPPKRMRKIWDQGAGHSQARTPCALPSRQSNGLPFLQGQQAGSSWQMKRGHGKLQGYTSAFVRGSNLPFCSSVHKDQREIKKSLNLPELVCTGTF